MADCARLTDGLTPAQRQAVLHREGPLLILAGAGSGKTRVVTRRIAALIADGARPDAILAITFTNKAAGEMRERVRALLPPAGEGAPEPWVSTFHAFAVRVLRQYAERIGWPTRFTILDAGDQLALIREAIGLARVDGDRYAPEDLAGALGRAKERLDDAAFAAAAVSDLERAAAAVLPHYRALQRERGALDFDDLVAETVRLLEQHDDVRRALNERLQHVSIDEYQDTNHSQYRLAQLLAGERRNLCVCGDPDQSIYGWRGADIGNILRFEQDFPGAAVIRLEENFRSSATILQAANALIEHNSQRKDKQLRPTGEAGVPIDVLSAMDHKAEADAVARRVQAELKAGTPAREVAVVFRASAHVRVYEEALHRHGVPCAMVGGTSFFDLKEVKDALAFVRLAAHAGDDLAALRALQAAGGVGRRTLDKVTQHQRQTGASVVDVCRSAGDVAGLTQPKKLALQRFAALVGDLGRQQTRSAEHLVVTAISRAGLLEGGRDAERDERRQANLRRLVEAARRADRRRGGGGDPARSFLDALALLDAQDRDEEAAADKVVLTTVHASKGLEFDVVLVVGLEEGLFPHRRSVEEGNLEEERRLAYVALTRARKRLILTYAARRAARRRVDTRRVPSTFLYELPGELLWDPQLREPMELPDREALLRAAAEAPARARPKVVLGAPADGKVLGLTRPAPTGDAAKPLWARGLTRRSG